MGSEVDVVPRGFEKTSIVGLQHTAGKESLERVHSALNNSGYSWPEYKTVINLAQADIKGAPLSRSQSASGRFPPRGATIEWPPRDDAARQKGQGR